MTNVSSAEPQNQITRTAVAISVPILIVLAVTVVALLSAVGCMVYCKRRNTDQQFRFKYMREGDHVETLDTPPEKCDADDDERKLDLGSGSHDDDAHHYEQPPSKTLNSGSVV